MSIVPEEVFKRRRHHFTPEATKLIIANFITVTVAISLFATKEGAGWFFWVVIAVLAVYNFLNIRKNIEEYDKPRVIGYAVSLAIIAILLVLVALRILHV